jgi:spore germination cell wall hydrolase CwlJ-like protein
MTEEEEASEAAESPFTEEELLLLAKITMVEAGYEPYEGQLAVVNVILNRLKDPRFPDTIRDVIYAPNQFPPAHNGLLDKAEPSESVWRAVREAVAGNNNVENAVYFYNPKVSSGKFWKSLTVIKDIGSHRFLK